MDGVDAIVLALLALADIALITYLRRRRARRLRVERMYYRMALAVRRDLANSTPPAVRIPVRAHRYVSVISPLSAAMR
jgi:hypothetical protein